MAGKLKLWLCTFLAAASIASVAHGEESKSLVLLPQNKLLTRPIGAAVQADNITFLNMQEADGFYSRAIRLNPEVAENYLKRGQALMYLKKYNEALEDFATVVKLEPKNAEGLYWMGEAYNNLGKTQEALKFLEKSLALEPGDYFTWAYRASIYREKLKKYDLAIADFSRALKLKPDYQDGYMYRAASYAALNKIDAGIKDMSKAIALKPDDAELYSKRGWFYIGNKQYDLAVADFTKAIEMKSDDYTNYANRGRAYFNKKLYKEAANDFCTALESKPDDINMLNLLAYSQLYQKRCQLALDIINTAIKLQPDTPQIIDSRGEIYEGMKRYEEALAEYKISEEMLIKEKDEESLKEIRMHINRVKGKMTKAEHKKQNCDKIQGKYLAK